MLFTIQTIHGLTLTDATKLEFESFSQANKEAQVRNFLGTLDNHSFTT